MQAQLNASVLMGDPGHLPINSVAYSGYHGAKERLAHEAGE